MLVTRVRLPACARTRPAWTGHLAWKSTTSCEYLAHGHMHHNNIEPALRLSMSVHTACPNPRHPSVVGKHSPDFVSSLRHIELRDSRIATSARSVAASYKPPMLVTRVRLPACAFLHLHCYGCSPEMDSTQEHKALLPLALSLVFLHKHTAHSKLM